MADTPKKKEPTASEAMFFFAIVKHTRNKADIDWTAVAAEQGFKNANVAKVRFGQVKRKLGITTNTDSPAPVRTPTKRTSAGTPTKVTKSGGRAGTKGRRAKTVKEECDDAEDDDETMVGVKDENPDADLDAEVESFLEEDPEDPF
ncbi:hypothetical protein VFPPC_17373 [Pochonia chlamydosporia 170]|uniref:Myb-like DNA-binding domain-containing protein n=1 Tax=Pochonia chlamydosporia 170 TaxID=1380566 RepID=A0A219ART3_METCM|nr:hypothetical protein VFPPC_17373 [Pochonia chlamydosporia 170]OWT43478.1 hypothetical protein VFPPC_17373 [Pochonia chlamydosporia 170]